MAYSLTYYLRDYQISNTAMLVYDVLNGLYGASRAKGKDYTYISRKGIAERVRRCERTTRSAVKELERVGLISIKRMGRGRNDRITVLPPRKSDKCDTESDTQTETARKNDKKNDNVFSAPCRSESAKVAALNINDIRDKSLNKGSISIYPFSDDAASRQKGLTPAKGKATPQRPRIDLEERRRRKQQYKDYLIKSLNLLEIYNDIDAPLSEIKAIEKIIDLIANTSAGKGKVMISGSLLTSAEWWYVAKNLKQDSLRDIIYRLPRFQKVKNPRAYLLATIYNAALIDELHRPFTALN